MPSGEGDGLEPSVDLEFREDVLNVGPHGVLADRQAPGDLGAAGSFAQEQEDVPLSRRQLSEQEFGLGVAGSSRRERLVGHHDLTVDHRLDGSYELRQRNILGHVSREPQTDRLAHRFGVVQGGHGDDLGLWKLGEDPFPEYQPVHVRKSQIDENELRAIPGHGRQGIGARIGIRKHVQPKVLQRDAYHIGEEPMVIDDEDQNRLAPPPIEMS